MGHDARPPVVVIAGGDPLPARLRIPAGAYVIAADSGVDHAAAKGVHVDLAVGDFDSVSPHRLAAATDAGTVVQRHPRDKDATDLELALREARRRRPRGRILVLGGYGGRLDHFIANALLLASPLLADVTVDALMGDALVQVVHERRELAGCAGEYISLLPVGGAAQGVCTSGLRYPLEDDDLPAGSTRGVSNEFTGTSAWVSLRSGTLLAIQPSPSPGALARLT